MKGWGWSKVQHPDHVDRAVARVKRSGETGEPWEDTFPLRGRDGNYRWFLSRAMPIRDGRGNIVQWFGTNTDVTEQKLAEEKVARQAQELRALNERLEELDRAKTLFLSNISHEFRTPLTLMLGPLEELKRDLGHVGASVSDQYQQVDLAHRNGLRLLKLVNTLLDFSRIEAGRSQALYESTDLAAATTELASVFRSAIEKAGLRLIIDCAPLSESAYVDREMWEKIALNLLSNALKFTFEGEIEVRLRETSEHFMLAVRDTGTGIPARELPKLFERFHRVEGPRRRSYEGSGIGLALVHELVKLHGGTISVESELGKGSTFTVIIPRGRSHLPAEQLGTARSPASTARRASHFVEEALRWLPVTRPKDDEIIADAAIPQALEPVSGESPYVLLADDNADMRDYLRQLLAPRYQVEVAPDGEAALAAISRRRPDLLLADIMMPRLDGMQLLARLRADPHTSMLPIILLSARAGEESRVEGMQSGADDYLIKPFSARELLARVEAHVKMARLRNEAAETLRASEEQLRFIVDGAHVCYWHWEIAADRHEWSPLCNRFFGVPPEEPIDYARFLAALHPDDRERTDRAIHACLKSGGQTDYDIEYRTQRPDETERWIHTKGTAAFADGKPVRMAGIALDITERKEREEREHLLVREMNHRVKNILTVVDAIAHRTAAENPEDFAKRFSERIRALSANQDLLFRNEWQGVDVEELVRAQLSHFADLIGSRIVVDGPKLRFNTAGAQAIGLALHELATNAGKYGALSTDKGRVDLRWNFGDNAFTMSWTEREGPTVSAPKRRGFGTTVIERMAKSSLGGAVDLNYAPSGLTWCLTCPARNALERRNEDRFSR
jgi:PAS domain S-box-containing protein